MPGPIPKRCVALPSLKDAEWLKRPEMARVFAALDANGIETRAVGGAVRDALLGRTVKEVDLATTAPPDKVIALARKAGLRAIPTGIEHGTVTVVADGAAFEVTTLRRDVETFGRHAVVAFTENWEEDARRRDFTLNALYADRGGTVFDPLEGYDDLAAGRVRFIGNAEERIREDYLRILRFFRFTAYYGKGRFDADGLLASVKLRAGLAQLSAERIKAELWRLLVAPRAMEAVAALYDYGLLSGLLASAPRIVRLNRLIEIEAAQKLEADAARRLASLAVFVQEDAPRLGVRFKLSNAEQAVLELGAKSSASAALPAEDAARRVLYELGESKFSTFVLLAWASAGAAPDDPRWVEALTLPQRWQAPAFPLRGTDILDLSFKGAEVGEILRALERTWIESGFALSREDLLAHVPAVRKRSSD
jgi:tRNA nucleotidyltransferase/poly(A) polymerase